MYRKNVRVRKSGHRSRLALEAAKSVRVCGEVRWKHLDRHCAPETGIDCPVDFTHAAGSHELDDLVMAEDTADHGSRTGIRDHLGGDFCRRRSYEFGGIFVGGDKRLDFGSKAVVGAADV